jgi:hypothetical protein
LIEFLIPYFEPVTFAALIATCGVIVKCPSASLITFVPSYEPIAPLPPPCPIEAYTDVVIDVVLLIVQ